MANQLEITLTKSCIGRSKSQRDTVGAIGLKKMHQTVLRQDNPETRGMIAKVSHLLTVKEV